MTIYEKSQVDQHAYSLPKEEEAFLRHNPPKDHLRQEELILPEVSEIDLTRHFNALAKKNMGIDNNFYPLGSCTMKLNPRVNEWAACIPSFNKSHPFAPEQTVQGNLQIIYELIEELCSISGMTAGTLGPNAGAQGEFTGVRLIAAYHQDRKDTKRTEMLIPDNAHGTNPATAKMCGMKTITIKSDPNGDMNLEDLRAHVSERTAGLMLTNPNTLGLFSPNILQIAKIVHEAGGLLYYDGANLNPILYVTRPGDMGFDVMHINLHKTFSTPHGGGGPGSGPVLCNDKLKAFLPIPKVDKQGDYYKLIDEDAQSIGRISTFKGNFAIYLRAYLYIKLHGVYGLRRIAEGAVLNANYLKAFISDMLKVPFSQPCMHEFVVQADRFLPLGVRAFDIAKRLIDFGMHPPTIYFPLIIKECLLIEPTESESKATLDAFLATLQEIIEEIEENPEVAKTAPHSTPVSRLDEVYAAKQLKLRYETDSEVECV